METKKNIYPQSVNEIKKGDRVIPFKLNVGDHNYELGKEYIVTDINGKDRDSFKAKDPETGRVGNNLYAREVYFGTANTKEGLEEEKEKLECELDEIKTKLKFMEEHGLDEFDEEEYKVYKTLDVIEDDNKSRKEKAKEISKLIKDGGCSSGC